MTERDPVTVMVAAPRLPAPSQTPAYLPPGARADVPGTGAWDVQSDGAQTPAPASIRGPRARMLDRASAVHEGFLAACGGSQAVYLHLMTDAVTRRGGPPGRLVGRPPSAPLRSSAAEAPRLEGDAALASWLDIRGEDVFVDLVRAPWIGDHRPDHGVAVLPMTAVVEIVAASAQAGAPGRKVARVSDLSLRSWIVVGEVPLRLRREVVRRLDGTYAVTLLAWREAARAALSRDEPVASGVVEFADTYPPPPADPEPLAAPEPVPDPYASAELFHGPAFRLLRAIRADGRGATAALDFAPPDGARVPAPTGVLHPVALDAALQVGAVKRWGEWCGAEVGGGKCLPVKLRSLTLHGPTPEVGDGRIELRGRGVDGHPRFPLLEFSVYAGDRLWARMEVVFVAVPAGSLDAFPSLDRRAHLRDRVYVPGVRVSREAEGVTSLRDDDLAAANWIPDTIRTAYGIEAAGDPSAAVAMREHAAARFEVHPFEVAIEGVEARCAARPDRTIRLDVVRDGAAVTVRDAQ